MPPVSHYVLKKEEKAEAPTEQSSFVFVSLSATVSSDSQTRKKYVFIITIFISSQKHIIITIFISSPKHNPASRNTKDPVSSFLKQNDPIDYPIKINMVNQFSTFLSKSINLYIICILLFRRQIHFFSSKWVLLSTTCSISDINIHNLSVKNCFQKWGGLEIYEWQELLYTSLIHVSVIWVYKFRRFQQKSK